MSWSPQQEEALKAVKDWYQDKSAHQVFRLFGYAGTGKTTLAREIESIVDGAVLYATFTGKAALVLRKKGCEGATTIHSLIYKSHVDPKTGEVGFTLNYASPLLEAKILIVDEVSMVGKELARDLLSFGIRILVLGDPAQLPPVKSEGYFIDAIPNVMLTEVHRQAKDNPIIAMSMDIRAGKTLEIGNYGESQVISAEQVGMNTIEQHIIDSNQLICGLNKTRANYNQRLRRLKNLENSFMPWLPVKGDRLICLKNKHDQGLLNGGIWDSEKVEIEGPRCDIRVNSLDEKRDPLTITVPFEFFNGTDAQMDWREKARYHQFTYGWAITCHKSQGSQWDHVSLFDESGSFREFAQNWLYTAVTRASEKVTVIR